MYLIAVKMMIRDRAKYLGLVLGVAFATLLTTQQTSIFIGLMARTASFVRALPEVDIWVTDPRVDHIDEIEPLRRESLAQVRSVSGVEWAVPLHRSLVTIREGQKGLSKQAQVIGIDFEHGVGLYPKMISGNASCVYRYNTVLMDAVGYGLTWPQDPLRIGRMFEICDQRVSIGGFCQAQASFFSWPMLFTSYKNVEHLLSPSKKILSCVLVKVLQGLDPKKVAENIRRQTGLQALDSDTFAWRSISHVLNKTGIAINFSITILLGLIVGAAITAQTFYLFVVDNLKPLAALKAVGVTNRQLLKIVLVQACLVGLTGYGVGIGMTNLCLGLAQRTPTMQGISLNLPVAILGLGVMTLIVLASLGLSLRRLFSIDPAQVFRG